MLERGFVFYGANTPETTEFCTALSSRGVWIARRADLTKDYNVPSLANLVHVPNEVLFSYRLPLILELQAAELLVAVISATGRHGIERKSKSLKVPVESFWQHHHQKVIDWLDKSIAERKSLL